MLSNIRQQLSASIDRALVEALLSAYVGLKQNYYLSKHKPSELDAGHFAEVAIRVLQHITTSDHTFTPLGRRLENLDREIARFAQLPEASFHESIRLHIPRAIYAMYGIRSRRGVAHVGGDVNPNLVDSSLVIAICDWILTELIRLYYTSSLEEAQTLVDAIVARKVPLIQEFDGFLKVLSPNISIANKALVLLYHKGVEGAFFEDLLAWIKTRPSYLNVVLQKLDNEAMIHYAGDRCLITRMGEAYVETNIPLHIAL